MSTNNLRVRAIEACERFLAGRGYDVIETNSETNNDTFDVVAKDGETLVFIEVDCRPDFKGGFAKELIEQSRPRWEKQALKFLAEHTDDYVDIPVRFDTMSLLVIGSDRAMIRHHINAAGGAEME